MFTFGKSNVKPNGQSESTSPTKVSSVTLEITDFENDENCNSSNVNTTKRSKLSKRASTNFSFGNNVPKEVEDLIKQLQNELQIKESVISNLGNQYNIHCIYEMLIIFHNCIEGLKVERLEDEIKSNANINNGILKRQHPSKSSFRKINLSFFLNNNSTS